ncbi:MAG: ABC transporter ATP-binding protein [Verrucomicrobia bacterium]|nr:ABC transporter ATP-binding protein [Verrucomicrobiota bacterium]
MIESTNGLLRVEGLTVDFDAGKPTEHRALDSVSLSIAQGAVVGLVGESGSGKTVLAHSIMGLLPRNGRVASGSIAWRDCELLGLSETKLRNIRGKEIAMIFQDPQASLNPVYRVGRQVEWVLKLHRGLTGGEAKSEILRLFDAVQLRDPERCFRSFPHQLSGGMCQRVMIAMALACRPKLLIADEPTSALDMTVQAEIVELLSEVLEKFQMTMLFITHNLAVAARLCRHVVVLQQGKVVERGATRAVFESPQAPYTQKLLQSIAVPEFKLGSNTAEFAPAT